ncbi:unnamed protein product [Rhizophagus irregularis]|uniref:Uncharacterized protein n=1 Tax=Rhizophagus irregularis TaxID=588596 RepID=A0A2I1G1V1_9GLOM|nr:hypothetical protein RhiirA4_454005 [Rhizophagus irregularis]CAB4436664.1 unnamed protein product [Rhizophagus irregularis]
MTFPLKFRLNACPICLICLDCQNIYGQKCACQAREVIWKRKRTERDYAVEFVHKPLTQKGATAQKVALDSGLIDWVFANISRQIEILPTQNDVNICQRCMNEYRDKKKALLVLTPSLSNNVQLISETVLQYVPLICFDKFKQPHKKLDGAIDIPFNLDNLTTYGQIEEEILSRTHNFPTEWGKIEIGLICYQKSSNVKGDHFNLKSFDRPTDRLTDRSDRPVN